MASAAAVALALLSGGCATPLSRTSAFIPFAEPAVDLAGRAAQVRRAASGLGWRVIREAPGRVELQRGGAASTVDFTERNFVVRSNEPATDELRQSIVAQSGF